MSDAAPRRTGAPARGNRALKPRVAAPVPTDPVELLDQPVGLSGFAAANVLRRAGRRLGVETVRDLLFHLPRRYDDLREMRTLDQLRAVDEGTVASARVRVTDVRVQQTFRRRVQVTTAFLADETGTAEATWFGRRFIERRLRSGDELIVSGKVKHRGFGVIFDDPEFQKADAANLLHVGRIVPVYRLTSGLTAARLRQAMREALDKAGYAYPEYLPEALRDEEAVPPIATALEQAHYPVTFEDRDAALRRLAFDELLALQLGMVARRRARGRAHTTPVKVADADAARARSALEASLARKLGHEAALTADQATAIDEIRWDLARPVPMLRLMQGDVGSGKTAVAAWALAAAALDGRQGALLAPTDLLARQHAATLGDLVEDLAVPVTLLTGSLTGESRKKALEAIATGQAGIVVGTHALLQEAVAFADLALAVVDEQHRFGVEQRGALEAKATRGAPHVLLMTATPIPRTLGQVIYADLDVSTLRAAPAGRVPIRTGIRRPNELDGTWDKVRDEAAAGRRTFVVVPRIGPAAPKDGDGEDAGDGFFDDDELLDEDVETAWAAAAEAEFERLTALLAPLRVGLVHGRLKPADRDAEMARFRDGELDVLVGTTVVEVGVDVPQATMMVIEGAERFGLAQLHQLRGRVGRGTDASFCVLVSDATEGTTEHERLKAVASTTDGFALAERDFELRREGDVLGLAQSGLPRLRVATLANAAHRELAARARVHAEALVGEDGEAPVDEALARELSRGWLRRVFAGDPASAA
ncbi:MAG TPA: ATP-dependent DNA helicase RecG [Candidatus Limnocylindrales bacterium]|nr:ATP-dependent DNA helicase RecG [Candidatus Limnocylindrales bacterium]